MQLGENFLLQIGRTAPLAQPGGAA